MQVLRQYRERGDGGELMFALRAELLRSLGNLTEVQRRCRATVPAIIRHYIDEVRAHTPHTHSSTVQVSPRGLGLGLGLGLGFRATRGVPPRDPCRPPFGLTSASSGAKALHVVIASLAMNEYGI